MRAIVTLPDVLEGTQLDVDGYLVDLVATVVVVQHSSHEFEIEKLDIVSDIRMHSNAGTYLGYTKFHEHDNMFQDKLISAIELVALEKARNTSEELWDYQLVD